MSPSDMRRTFAIRSALSSHVMRRLNEALSKIVGTDAAAEKNRNKQRDFFQLTSLISSGAGCVGQIQLATHIVKGIHPDPTVKEASNLNVDPMKMPCLPLVGSHVLAHSCDVDATGNGAFNKKILEVFLLLMTEFEGVNILALLKRGDPAAVAALSNTPAQATRWADALVDIDAPRCARTASHTNAKQVYWPVGNDPHDDGGYHLLAPLYPTSLIHRFYQELQQDRFSDATKAARLARKSGEFSEHVLHDYPNMAVQKLGGTKPQNISQLNSERRGENHLLASLPPRWKSIHLKPLLNTDSMFHGFGRRPDVKQGVKALLAFLMTDPPSNKATRDRVDALVDELVGELLVFGAELRALPPGWSQSTDCRLNAAERYWLDPEGVENAVEQSGQALPAGRSEQISQAFGRWLNRQLRDPLPMGDSEYLHWCALAQTELDAEEREVNHAG